MPNASRLGQRLRPTIHEVAAAAGVSIGTVSRVVGGHPRVAGATRSRVLAAMAELGYQPNAAARAMRTNRTRTIGFLIPDIKNNVFADVATGAEAVLAPAGYMVFAFSSNRSPEREVVFLQAARQRQMDGLIVSVADETAESTIAELRRAGVPVVLLDREMPIDADVVFSEHRSAVETLVRQLVALGHRRIGLITASERIRPGRDRVAAFRHAMASIGLGADEALVRAGRQSAEFGAAETQALMSLDSPPTALIAAGSDIFHGALGALRLLGIDIPGQLSFVGADDLMVSDLVVPPITMIHRDMVEVGTVAAQLLLDRLNGAAPAPRRVLLQSQVLLRPSIAAPCERISRGVDLPCPPDSAY